MGYVFSWVGIIACVGILIGRIFFSDQLILLQKVDVFLVFLILVDFVILNKTIRRSRVSNEIFWLWFLISLLFINFIWSLGINNYKGEGIYHFDIWINYLIIGIAFLMIFSTKGELRRSIVAHKKKLIYLDNNLEQEEHIEKEKKKEKKLSIAVLTLLGLIILFGGILRFYNLGDEALYHDQLIQYSAVMGVVKHGKAAIYNPVTDELSSPYSRASLLTYTSAFLIKHFGNTEAVIKFPVALAGTVLIPVFYFFSRRFVSTGFALFGSMLIAVNPYLIYLSRFFREYSLKILFFFIAALLLTNIVGKINKNLLDRSSLKILAIAAPFLYLSYNFGSAETTLLCITFLASVCSITIFNYKKITTRYSIKKILLSLIITCILLFIGSKFIGFLNLGYIKYIIKTHMNFDTPIYSSVAPIYQYYLFNYHFKYIIFFLLFISGIILFVKKKWQYIFIFFLLGLGYYVVAYLGDRYEDFRYISFLMPIAILAMVISFQLFWRSIKIFQMAGFNKVVRILFILVLISIPTYILPFKLPQAFALSQYTAVGQPWWRSYEGAAYIHRRAVAPEYKKMGSYLNSHSDLKNDIFIFTTSEYIYLNSMPVNSFLARWDTEYLQSLADSNFKIHYRELLSRYQCKNIWFIGTYVHLLNRELVAALLENPNAVFIGSEIGIMHYDYNNFYVNKQLTWPTLLKIPSSCEDMEIFN
ncbi:MAG: hypothetical protein PHI73_02400 [Patescibacteria group bacterium]|nr:hypothetical protein [Patescibacteria group bacterium]